MAQVTSGQYLRRVQFDCFFSFSSLSQWRICLCVEHKQRVLVNRDSKKIYDAIFGSIFRQIITCFQKTTSVATTVLFNYLRSFLETTL